ncbi:MAG: transglutaminase family protein, partial [Burkholderiales bacterium]
MKLNVRSDIVFDFQPETEIIASVQAASSPDQTILAESLILSPDFPILQDPADARGERRFRARVGGEVRIIYEAAIENGRRVPLVGGLAQHTWTELPAETLQYLTASRYCPSDLFISFATREFGNLEGSDRILAVLDWIH